MDHISQLLPKVLRKRGLAKHAAASLVVHKAREWISEHLEEFSQDLNVHQFKDGTLFIQAGNSIAAQECQQQATALLEHLRDVCEGTEIDHVRLVRT